MSVDSLDDLVGRARAGNDSARNQLVALLSAPAIARARQLLTGPLVQEAEDIVQNSLIRVLCKLGELEARDHGLAESLQRVLWTTIKRQVYNAYRQSVRSRVADLDAAADRILAETRGVVTRVMQSEAAADVRHRMKSLSETDRSMVVARLIEGSPFSALAERFGLKEATAKKRVYRAIDELRASASRG